MYKHGLVIGKFYPLHYGHMEVINAARRQSENVTVIVMGSSVDKVSAEERAEWINKCFLDYETFVYPIICESQVDYNSPIAWRQQVFAMEAVLIQNYRCDYPIDAVFSSEPYGEELAKRFAADHVLVDIDRKRVKTSGTEIRTDLVANWQNIPAVVRGALGLRAVFVGAESTGTTTVSQAVHEHYKATYSDKTRWVEEYGRHYTINKLAASGSDDMSKLVWTKEDFNEIRRMQQAIENQALWFGSPLAICDTDTLATDIWERRYVGFVHSYNVPPGNRIYFLTDHVGVDFEQDGIRDGEHVREEMTTWFADVLTRQGQAWTLLTGTREERLLTATTVIDRLLEQQKNFNDPIREN